MVSYATYRYDTVNGKLSTSAGRHEYGIISWATRVRDIILGSMRHMRCNTHPTTRRIVTQPAFPGEPNTPAGVRRRRSRSYQRKENRVNYYNSVQQFNILYFFCGHKNSPQNSYLVFFVLVRLEITAGAFFDTSSTAI